MSIVNFAIPKVLDKQINTAVKEKGFQSKAELFRFAVIYYLNTFNKPELSEEERFNYLTSELKNTLSQKLQGKKLASLEEQLADV